MKDLVSIITPSYNTAKYIVQTIESVQAQTYSNWEMIIVDDCSSDNTDEVVQSYLRDSRIRYIKNEKNSGAAVSRNTALSFAQGRWVAFLDSDDIWYPNKLEKQIAYMKSRNCAFSYTNYEEIDDNGDKMDIVVSGPKKITKQGMYSYCWPGCLTVMYDRNVVGNIQISDIKKNNDYAMWLKVCKKADCYLLPEILAQYRKRSGSISNHNYRSLIKWHYKLFKQAEQLPAPISIIFTVRNLICGLIKKIIYVNSGV